MEIWGKLVLWFKSFLQGLSQRVALNGIESQWSDITSGVPQGSVLGTLLILLNLSSVSKEHFLMTQRFIQLLEVFVIWTECKNGQKSIFLISTLRNVNLCTLVKP